MSSIGQIVTEFGGSGRPTLAESKAGIPYLSNEFWTARQRQGHSIHELSYRACFKPQLPGFFISHLSQPGDTVYDPFMGRGTTPIQAALMGRRPVGNDVNPLSILLTRPRLAPPLLAAVVKRLAQVPWHESVPQRADLLAFYSHHTLGQLGALRNWLLATAPLDHRPDPVDDWIRMVAITRLSGHSAGFFSVYTLPPNQAVSLRSQRKINEKKGQVPPDRDVAALVVRKSRSLLRSGKIPAHPPAMLTTGPAAATPMIADGSVDLVVTSPPFLDIVDYAEDNWLRNWFAGIDSGSVSISRHHGQTAWQTMISATLGELARVTRPGGHVAFEVGEVCSGGVLLERLVWDAAARLPFERLFVMVNQQIFTKTAHCWGVGNNEKGTNSNRIVMLRRHGA